MNDIKTMLADAEKRVKLKGIEFFERLSNELNIWLETQNISTRIDDSGFWSYCSDTDTIGICVFDSIEEINDWEKFLYEDLHYENWYPSFYTSFFHELGHAFTYHCFSLNDRLTANRSLTTFDYFHSPIEKTATIWGMTYIQEHKDAFERLRAAIDPILDEVTEYYEG